MNWRRSSAEPAPFGVFPAQLFDESPGTALLDPLIQASTACEKRRSELCREGEAVRRRGICEVFEPVCDWTLPGESAWAYMPSIASIARRPFLSSFVWSSTSVSGSSENPRGSKDCPG